MSLWGGLEHPYGILVAQWLLAAVFLAAAASKLRHRRRFVAIVLAYQILPRWLARLFARALPWLELALGLCLLLNLAARAAALAGAALFSSFLVAIGVNMLRGRQDLNCGCFGRGHRIGWSALGRDLLLLGASLLVAYLHRGVAPLWCLLPALKGLRGGVPPEDIAPLVSTVVSVWIMQRLGRRLLTHTKAGNSDEWTLAGELHSAMGLDGHGGTRHPGPGT